MIAWLMRRRCLWCARSPVGMCWSHLMRWKHRLDVAGRWALVVSSVLAIAFLWALVGQR